MERNKLNRDDLQRLARDRVLTTEDLSKVLRTSRRHAARLAFSLKQRGFLTSVQRGLYASVPLEADPQRFQPDPFLAVNRAFGGGFAFSHFSALALMGGEETVRKTVHVSGQDVRPRRRTLGSYSLHVHSISSKDWQTATMRVRRGGEMLLVTTPARTLVDLAGLPNPQQDYDADLEAFRTLLPRTGPGELLREAESIAHVSTRARFGHLLQASASQNRAVSEVLRLLERSIERTGPTYFATRPKNPSNRFDPRFKVVYPGRE